MLPSTGATNTILSTQRGQAWYTYTHSFIHGDRVQCILPWPGIHYVAEDGHKLLALACTLSAMTTQGMEPETSELPKTMHVWLWASGINLKTIVIYTFLFLKWRSPVSGLALNPSASCFHFLHARSAPPCQNPVQGWGLDPRASCMLDDRFTHWATAVDLTLLGDNHLEVGAEGVIQWCVSSTTV